MEVAWRRRGGGGGGRGEAECMSDGDGGGATTACRVRVRRMQKKAPQRAASFFLSASGSSTEPHKICSQVLIAGMMLSLAVAAPLALVAPPSTHHLAAKPALVSPLRTFRFLMWAEPGSHAFHFMDDGFDA